MIRPNSAPVLAKTLAYPGPVDENGLVCAHSHGMETEEQKPLLRYDETIQD
jgi:hypothetical protein